MCQQLTFAMSTNYMWLERGLELDSLSDALPTAVAVLAVECEKPVSTTFSLKYGMYIRRRRKHYFGTTLGLFLKQSEVRKYY